MPANQPRSLDPESREKWYVVETKPRQETVAAINLRNQGFFVFTPKIRRPVRHARQTFERIVPLFPGYLFIRNPLDRWRSVNGTVGAKRIVTNGTDPVEVEYGVVKALQVRAGHDDVIDFSWKDGCDYDQLLGEPFGEQMANLAALDDQRRVFVLLDLVTKRSGP